MHKFDKPIFLLSLLLFISCGESKYPPGSKILSYLGISTFQSQMAYLLMDDGKHEKSLELCFKLIEKENPDGYLVAGMNYFELKKYDDAIKYLQGANGKSNGLSESLLGDIYATKLDEPDIQEALLMFEEAGKQGLISSLVKLGKIYFEGQLVSRDLELAEKWFQKAIEFQYVRDFNRQFDFDKPEANYYLGLICEEKGDLKKAIFYLEKSVGSKFAPKNAAVKLKEIKSKKTN